jgi:hypothetical protein
MLWFFFFFQIVEVTEKSNEGTVVFVFPVLIKSWLMFVDPVDPEETRFSMN